MNVLRWSPATAYFLVPILGSADTVVRVPLAVRDYRALETPDATPVDALFRQRYPAGLRRLPPERLGPAMAVGGLRSWGSIFTDERGALTFGTGNQAYVAAGASSITTSITAFASSSSTDALFAWAATDRDGTTDTPDAISFNAVALTLNAIQTGPSNQRIRSGVLVAPASGAKNLVSTFANINSNKCHLWMAYTGVDQTTPLDTGTVSGVSGTGTAVAAWTFSVAAGNLGIGAAAFLANAQTYTGGTDTTLRVNGADGSVGNFGRVVAGEEGSTSTLSWTVSGSTITYGQAFEINADAGGAVTTVFRQMISSTMRPGSRPMGAA